MSLFHIVEQERFDWIMRYNMSPISTEEHFRLSNLLTNDELAKALTRQDVVDAFVESKTAKTLKDAEIELYAPTDIYEEEFY